MAHVRVGYAGALSNHNTKRQDASCQTGGFYTNPTNGQSLDATAPLNISWDTTCLSTSTVDIYLYAPGSQNSLIHQWNNVGYAAGHYMATLQPSWWNGSASENMQFTIIQSGTLVAMNPLPAGPIFTATYSGSPTSSSGTTGSEITDVGSLETKKGLSKGGIAAAIIFPLLIVTLCIAVWVRFSRAKAGEKSKRWSEAIDKRMSTISTDWKSMSAAGANAAIRNSMAGNRASSFSFGAIRPSSQFSVDADTAGSGSKGLYMHDNNDLFGTNGEKPQMSQLRSDPRPSVNGTGERVSRVSFAADTRPSIDRKSIASRAFHTGFVPPVPPRRDSGMSTLDDLDAANAMSPTQTQGALTLDPEDINAKVSGVEEGVDVMPALSMMRTGVHHTEFDADAEEAAQNDDDWIIPRAPPAALPTPPLPTAQISPSKSLMMDMQPMPANVMSPDEMLRAYATRRVTSSPGTPAPAFPAPAVNYNGNGMRTLYSPVTPGPMIPNLYACGQDEENHEDAYGGTG
jgi:hypothetical protein